MLHMADGPEANKNLDDLDEMEMEEDLVPAREALLDEMGEDLVPAPEARIRPRILHTDPPSPQQEVEAEAAEGVEAEVVAVAVVAPRRSVRSPPPPRRRAKPGQPVLGVPRWLLQAGAAGRAEARSSRSTRCRAASGQWRGGACWHSARAASSGAASRVWSQPSHTLLRHSHAWLQFSHVWLQPCLATAEPRPRHASPQMSHA